MIIIRVKDAAHGLAAQADGIVNISRVDVVELHGSVLNPGTLRAEADWLDLTRSNRHSRHGERWCSLDYV